MTRKMKKLCCIIYGQYRKFGKPKTSYHLEITLVVYLFLKHYFFILVFYYLQQVQKWRWKIFKEEDSNEIIKILGLIENIQLL